MKSLWQAGLKGQWYKERVGRTHPEGGVGAAKVGQEDFVLILISMGSHSRV